MIAAAVVIEWGRALAYLGFGTACIALALSMLCVTVTSLGGAVADIIEDLRDRN